MRGSRRPPARASGPPGARGRRRRPGPSRDPLLRKKPRHHLRPLHRLPRVTVVEEEVDLPRLLLELPDLLDPRAKLLFRVGVIIAVSLAAAPPVLGVPSVKSDVARRACRARDRR